MYVCVVVFMCTTLHMQGHPPPDLPLATLLQYSAQPSHTQSRTQPDLPLRAPHHLFLPFQYHRSTVHNPRTYKAVPGLTCPLGLHTLGATHKISHSSNGRNRAHSNSSLPPSSNIGTHLQTSLLTHTCSQACNCTHTHVITHAHVITLTHTHACT
jgi:hypothetical protein